MVSLYESGYIACHVMLLVYVTQVPPQKQTTDVLFVFTGYLRQLCPDDPRPFSGELGREHVQKPMDGPGTRRQRRGEQAPAPSRHPQTKLTIGR